MSLFISCNNPDTPEPEVIAVDSTKLKPELDFSYQILDSGWVQFYNNTKNVKSSGWGTIWGSTSGSPKFWFPNGEVTIRFRGISKFDVISDTTFSFNVNNSIPQIDSERFVKGVFFGDTINLKYNSEIQNSFLGWPLFFYGETPVAAVWPSNEAYIIMADFNEVSGTDVVKLRNLLKVGNVPLVKYNTDTLINGNVFIKERLTEGWNFFMSHVSGSPELSNRRQEIVFTGTGEDESLEIIDIKEIYQAPVFPGLETTAFIATFHYRGKIWGQPTQTSSRVYEKIPGRDNIDLTFDVKFNVYPKWAME
ncbi:hypothetical protein DJ013_03025 [Arcticibacterium luteifluviistationis]|uniref:Uncharacterized protein n=2 Tax=Arcticibacterium luteifluviistationis TaxID=1784714 RepID=A0A2Z4G7N8_9BACT|nr:hypothetical protein DJ013_03025 [Arcticibacterium luteifluviistationis]